MIKRTESTSLAKVVMDLCGEEIPAEQVEVAAAEQESFDEKVYN
jgi:hypothetical protein